MKKIKSLFTVGLFAGAGLLLRHILKRSPKQSDISQPEPQESPEEAALREWTALLASDAGVYTGMFRSLQRVADGKAKKPGKVLQEWCARTEYKWPEGAATQLCRVLLLPAAEVADLESCARWADLLLNAAQKAGITPEEEQELTLDDTSARAYIEWDNQELYPGSRIKVINPAWYQNGTVVEQGMASLL